MAATLERIAFNLAGPTREETLDGRKHLVVPTVMIVEGVLNGSNGPGFYPKAETARAIKSWNHKPIVFNHPNIDGPNEGSAASKEVIDSQRIGILMNTKMPGNKLQTEAWVDIEKANAIHTDIVQKLKDGKKLEVSTGLYVERTKATGVFNKKKYEWIAVNHQPDHLAVFLDKVGASSIADGAGMLQLNEMNDETEPTENEMSHSEVYREIRNQLASSYGEKGKPFDAWIEDVFPSYVIYGDRGKLYSHEYNQGKDGKITLKGSPTPVSRSTTYKTPDGKPVGNEEVPVSQPSKEISVMAFDKTAHIANLVANGYETKKEWLEKLPDDVLQGILPIPKAAPVPPPVTAPALNQQVVVQPYTPPSNITEFINTHVPPELRPTFNDMANAAAAEKEGLVQMILKAPGNIVSEVDLRGAPTNNLRAMAALLPKATANQGNAGSFLGQWTPGPVMTPVAEAPPFYKAPTINFGAPAPAPVVANGKK